MGKLIDITGKKFGRLTCLSMEGRDKGHVTWKFKCDCGNVKILRGLDVRQGKTLSCGCYQIEQTKKANTKKKKSFK